VVGLALMLMLPVWIEIESAAVKVDRRLVVFAIAEATSHFFHHPNLAVQSFGGGVDDTMSKIGQDVFLVGDLYPPDIPPEAYLSNLPNLPNPLLTLYPQIATQRKAGIRFQGRNQWRLTSGE